MNIKAQTTLDEKTFQALYKLNMVGTSKPKNRFIFWGVVLAVAVAVVVVEIILSDGATPIMWAVLVILLLFPLLYYRMYKVAPKKRYKKLGAFQDSVNTFHFTDDAVLVTSHNSRGGYLGEATIYYSMLRRVRESDDYFFKAVLWASETGIAKGDSDGTYGVGLDCLREHMVTFLSKYDAKFGNH